MTQFLTQKPSESCRRISYKVKYWLVFSTSESCNRLNNIAFKSYKYSYVALYSHTIHAYFIKFKTKYTCP